MHPFRSQILSKYLKPVDIEHLDLGVVIHGDLAADAARQLEGSEESIELEHQLAIHMFAAACIERRFQWNDLDTLVTDFFGSAMTEGDAVTTSTFFAGWLDAFVLIAGSIREVVSTLAARLDGGDAITRSDLDSLVAPFVYE